MSFYRAFQKKVIAIVGQTSVNSPTRMDYIAKQGKDGAGAQWRADRLPFLTDVWHCAQNTICLLQHTGEDLPAAWSPILRAPSSLCAHVSLHQSSACMQTLHVGQVVAELSCHCKESCLLCSPARQPPASL